MSMIRKAIEDNDPKDPKFEQIKASLDLLDKLATLKLSELNDQVNQQLEDKNKFKMTHQERTKSGTHVTATDDADNISKAVGDIIGGFCAGSSDGTQKAVTGIIGTALTMLLGAGEGQETNQLSYAAIAEDEILKRLDVAYWSYGIAAKGITEKRQTAIAYSCVKSYIDATDVHATELVSMYHEAARLAGKPEDKQSILDALVEARKVLAAMKDDPKKAEERHIQVVAAREKASYAQPAGQWTVQTGGEGTVGVSP